MVILASEPDAMFNLTETNVYYLGRNLTCLTHLSDIMLGQLFTRDPFSEKRKIKLEINAKVGAVEFQVKLDQEVQFGRDRQRQKYNRLRCLLLVKGLVAMLYQSEPI